MGVGVIVCLVSNLMRTFIGSLFRLSYLSMVALVVSFCGRRVFACSGWVSLVLGLTSFHLFGF